jgi:F0F1-type ATP synthase membrane subunit b/b'
VQEYKEQIRRETISKAVELAEKIIKDKLTKDDERRILKDYMEKVQ